MSFTKTVPITIGGVSALLTFPDGNVWQRTGIVLCRPWGRDEVCCRKFYRLVADRFAREGFPAIRFDYPGMADSLDGLETDGLDTWGDAANAVAQTLMEKTGCTCVVLFGLGLGSAIAHMAASRTGNVAGVIEAAPVPAGRRYIREVGLHAKMAFESEHLSLDLLEKDKVSIIGNILPDGIADDLKQMKLESYALDPKIPILMFTRDGNTADSSFAEHLETQGHSVTLSQFDGYDALVGNVLETRPDFDLIDTAVNWTKDSVREEPGAAPDIEPEQAPAILETDTFREEAFFLEAAGKRLYCVETRPHAVDGETQVFLFGNTGGYDHHGGRARDWVTASRRLAKAGVISVRYDSMNTGDSVPDFPKGQEILYSTGAIEDFQDLIRHFGERYKGPITLIGRCSSAYAALHAAVQNARVKRLILINQLKFILNSDDVVDLRYMGHRSPAHYKKRLTSAESYKRLLRGEYKLSAASRGIRDMIRQRVAERAANVIPSLTKFGRMKLEALDNFRLLRERGVNVNFLSTIGDESLNLLKAHFGPDLKKFQEFPNIALTTIDNSDHNLMPAQAREEMYELLEKIARTPSGP
jgi:pimeloyl-ACP methyl ester carboxylesterase